MRPVRKLRIFSARAVPAGFEIEPTTAFGGARDGGASEANGGDEDQERQGEAADGEAGARADTEACGGWARAAGCW